MCAEIFMMAASSAKLPRQRWFSAARDCTSSEIRHYVLYFEEDKEFDPLVPPYPNEEVAFLKPNSKRPKVSGAQLHAAQAAYKAKK